ncbi:hypothetical protein EV424DRAFT_1345868 [Suillus variegatus]|nr:hypothetical protein EV424DRAFT_1345868 [Suillus variegatus]
MKEKFPEKQRKRNYQSPAQGAKVFESPNGTNTGSETDTEDGFPLTPDSKHSGSAYRHITGTSPGAQLSSCWEDLPVTVTIEHKLWTAMHLDELSPASCRFIVHYKEAVRECQRMRLFMTYWELEETTRLHTLLTSLYGEEDLEFCKIEKETGGLLKALVAKQSLSRTAADLDFLTATRQRNKTSLRETDAWLDLLKDCTTQTRMHPIKSFADNLNNTSNCVGSSPNATHA